MASRCWKVFEAGQRKQGISRVQVVIGPQVAEQLVLLATNSSRPVRPRRGEDDEGRDGLSWRRPRRGGRPSTAVDYRRAKFVNETNTSTQIS